MRILLSIDGLGSGGAQTQFTQLAILLKQKGLDVDVVFWVDRTFNLPNLERHGIKVHKLQGTNKIKRIFDLYRLRKKLNSTTVISYIPSSNMPWCIVKMFDRGFNLIVSERSHTVAWSKGEKIKYYLYRFSDKLVANSESEAENIRNHISWLRLKTMSIPNTIDTDKFVSGKTSKHLETKMIVVGRIIPVKNIDNFLHALHMVVRDGHDLKVEWYGDVLDEKYNQYIQSLVKELNLEKNISFHKAINDIEAKYAGADVFCLPSLREGYPNVLVEAMSAELPVVCSGIYENKKIVEEGVNGFLFDPKNPKDIASSMEKILDLSESERKMMGLINRKKVIENNSAETFINKYIHLLK